VSNDDNASWAPAWKLFPGDVAYVWHGGLRCIDQAESLEQAGFVIRSQIVWNKGRLVIGRGVNLCISAGASVVPSQAHCSLYLGGGSPAKPPNLKPG
jgi:N6-adenosine-specific RNA methylase IME4